MQSIALLLSAESQQLRVSATQSLSNSESQQLRVSEFVQVAWLVEMRLNLDG